MRPPRSHGIFDEASLSAYGGTPGFRSQLQAKHPPLKVPARVAMSPRVAVIYYSATGNVHALIAALLVTRIGVLREIKCLSVAGL